MTDVAGACSRADEHHLMESCGSCDYKVATICTERCEHGHTRAGGCKACFWIGGQCRCARPVTDPTPTTAALTDVQIARLLNEQAPDKDALRRALEQALGQRDEARYALDRVGAEVRRVTKW